jgi:hypothetical protein
MRKLLIVANVSKEHIRKFHIPVIAYMKDQLWQVDVACRMDAPIPECDHAFDLPCDRNPFSGGITKSIRILKDILSKDSYDAILCNTVTGGLIGRIAAKSFRKNGLKVFYLNHGLRSYRKKIEWLINLLTLAGYEFITFRQLAEKMKNA